MAWNAYRRINPHAGRLLNHGDRDRGHPSIAALQPHVFIASAAA